MTYYAKIIDGRTIELPADLLAQMALKVGGTISVELRGDSLVLGQASPIGNDAAPTRSLVDELIAERRAAFEAEEASLSAAHG